MSRMDIALATLLTLCALAAVQAQHRARTLFIELEGLKKEARELEVEWGKLQLEQSTLVDPKRVEGVAKNQLGLVSPAFDKIWLLEESRQ
jgi:cell division protein FtsL